MDDTFAGVAGGNPGVVTLGTIEPTGLDFDNDYSVSTELNAQPTLTRRLARCSYDILKRGRL